MTPQFSFEVMQPMDRPVHRWDTCCRDWWGNAWGIVGVAFRMREWRLVMRCLPSALQPIFGTCPWHGLQTRMDDGKPVA